MITINQNIVLYSIVILVAQQLILINLKYKINSLVAVNIVLFTHISLSIISTNNQTLVYVFLLNSNIMIYLFYKFVSSKYINFLIITNYTVLIILSTLSFINIVLVVELINIVFIGIILSNSNTYLNYKKRTYIILITLNVVTLVLFIVTIFFLMTSFRSTDMSIILHFLHNKSYWYLQYMIYLSIFVKLGLFVGPLYNQHLYSSINNNQLILYLYLYYWILPVLFINILNCLQINEWLLLLVFLISLIFNIAKIKNFKEIQSIIFISGQINLIYLQLLLL